MSKTPARNVSAPDLDAYERKPGEPETLGDEKGRFDGQVPAEALRESEKARHPVVKSDDGRLHDGRDTGAPPDPFGEELVSDEPRYDDVPAR